MDILFIAFKREYVYERLYYYTAYKKNHNAEKSIFSNNVLKSK